MEKEKSDFAARVRGIRGGISQTEFGRHICHYSLKRSGMPECQHYKRGEIGNWESGRAKPPAALETYISLALIEYDKSRSGWTIAEDGKTFRNVPGTADCAIPGHTNQERNERYEFVRTWVREALGLDFYCRRLHDMLLIQVCRGILTFEEVPVLEEELNAMVQVAEGNVSSRGELRKAALQSATENMGYQILMIEKRGQITKEVKYDSLFYFTAGRTLGERMRKIYDNRLGKETGLTVSEAAKIYAPNYRDSHNRIFSGQGITREWLLDLCIHLRFNREEIQEILKNAHMAPLSDEDGNEEELIRPMYGLSIGSAGWQRERKHYLPLAERPLTEKLEMMLLACNLTESEEVSMLPPPDYVLESFFCYGQGEKALEAAESLAKGAAKADPDDRDAGALQRQLLRKTEKWQDEYVFSGRYLAEEKDGAVMAAFRKYREEFTPCYRVDRATLLSVPERDREELQRLHYLASLFYMILTGRYFEGKPEAEALAEARRSVLREGDQVTDNFLRYVMGTFLDGRDLKVKAMTGNRRGFCPVDPQTGRAGRALDMTEIVEDLWDALIECKTPKGESA